MTIKEIEELSGMTRANIRFYESEGLLMPVREANGYRDYSESDLEILKRIKLLRSLHFSLEEIKELHQGKKELMELLPEHMQKLSAAEEDIGHVQKICKQLQKDGADYRTMDAGQYFRQFEQIQAGDESVKVLPADTGAGDPGRYAGDVIDSLVRPYIPWRRFFARALDYALYFDIWRVFLIFVFQVNLDIWSKRFSVLDSFVAVGMMLLLEPLFLSLTGTTPGKWLFGIKIMDLNGKRLDYGTAFTRTWKVLCYGMAFNIPVLQLWRSFKSWWEYDKGFEWEYSPGNRLAVRDEKKMRFVFLAVAYLLLAGIQALAVEMVRLPRNRGDITVEEFCENFNRMIKYYDLELDGTLTRDGWVENKPFSGAVVYIGQSSGGEDTSGQETNRQITTSQNNSSGPKVSFMEEDGKMTGMKMELELENCRLWGDLDVYKIDALLAVLSYVGAQEECGLFSKERRQMAKMITESQGEFYFEYYGIQAAYEVEYSGFHVYPDGMLLATSDVKETYYHFCFTMQRADGSKLIKPVN